MLQDIDKEITNFLVKAQVTQNLERKEVSKNKITNDNDDTKPISKPKKSEKQSEKKSEVQRSGPFSP